MEKPLPKNVTVGLKRLGDKKWQRRLNIWFASLFAAQYIDKGEQAWLELARIAGECPD